MTEETKEAWQDVEAHKQMIACDNQYLRSARLALLDLLRRIEKLEDRHPQGFFRGEKP